VRDAAARKVEKFDGIIQRSGIASARLDNGKYFFDIVSEKIGTKYRLARIHPVDISAQSVDFSVVADVPERMRQLPVGKRVGGKSLMHET
jgi:hypothetical protein